MFNAIEPIAKLRKLRRRFTLQVLYLTPNLGDRGAGFGLHCIETGLQVSKGSGILRAQTLRGVHMRRGRVKSFGRNSSAMRIWTNRSPRCILDSRNELPMWYA